MNTPSLTCPAIYPIRPLNDEKHEYKNILVFDTETTGLLKFNKVNGFEELVLPLDKNQPYLTQISYMVYNIEQEKVVYIGNDYCQLPDGVEISTEASQITGITKDILAEKGRNVVDVLMEFMYIYLNCDVVVAHNWNFDKTVIEIEIKRNERAIKERCGDKSHSFMEKIFHPDYLCLNNVYSFCTMLESTHLCDIRKKLKNGQLSKNPKYPKLAELYEHLFGETPDGQLHNSLYDVCACLRCFIKLRLGKEMPRNRYYHLLRDCDTVNNGTPYEKIKKYIETKWEKDDAMANNMRPRKRARYA
jgi:DNA polymerase III epsilon subunit-like protein